MSPPTLLALSADGYFSGFNLISASPAGLMREKQYLEKLNFFFLEQGRQKLGVVWEEGKKISNSALAFSTPFKFPASDGQKPQYSSTDQLLSEGWGVPWLFREFCAVLGLLQ